MTNKTINLLQGSLRILFSHIIDVDKEPNITISYHVPHLLLVNTLVCLQLWRNKYENEEKQN